MADADTAVPASSPPTRRRYWLGAGAIGLAASIWGLWGVAVRQAGVGGAVASCLVLCAIGTFSAPLLPRRIPRGWSRWWPLLATGLTDAGNALLYFEALSRGPMPVAVLSHYLAPVLVAVFTPLVVGQRPSARVWWALPASLLGLVLLLGPAALGADGSHTATTALLGAGSAVFYAAQTVIQKRAGDRLTPSELLVWHAWISALVLLPFALQGPLPSGAGVAWLLVGALVGGTLAGSIFLWGLQFVPAPTAGVLTYLEPLVGVLAGVVVLGEGLPELAPVGAVLVVASGVWVVRGR
jgi:drug/metabolite transporter (DMT)-like permease